MRSAAILRHLPAAALPKGEDLVKPIMGEGKIAICAHRGFRKRAPENSLESVTDAVEGGFDAVEVDVRESKDGVLVLMHDETVDRTTTGSGAVSSFTLDEIQKLEFKRGKGFQLPTLDRVLSVAAGRIVVYIDIKSDRLDLIVDQVRGHNAYDWTVLYNSDPEKIVHAKQLDPHVNVHTSVNSAHEVDRLLERVQPTMVELSKLPEPAFVDFLHEKGLFVELDTMGGPDFWGGVLGLTGAWRRYLASGADFLMSDYPDKLRSLIGFK